MSIQSESVVLPPELHTCGDHRGYYGSCRCDVNTTVISSDHPFEYLSLTSRSRANDQGIDSKFESGTFAEHFGSVSITSMPHHQGDRLHHRPPRQVYSDWKFNNESRSSGARQESPNDVFECSAMMDSESSSSPASSTSPGSLAPHRNSPFGAHTLSHLEVLSSSHHHPRQQPQQKQQQQQQICVMNTQQAVNHLHHNNNHHQHQPHFQRGPKRRAVDNQPVDDAGVGNRKERRRTQSINTAFAELRDCIPNVPADTKLSKIKTLRLATSYIAYLTDMVSKDDNMNGDMESTTTISGMMLDNIGDVASAMPMIRQDFSLTCRSIIKDAVKSESAVRNDCEAKRKRNRTGWPEHVWALELQH
ncbi:uncharacterized protein LOC129260129 [Lytechinus pictus]|uniref:uncharacterized protein LOC129260129 n=1 Tax=Lytechinus pictus TaxID=7653 RepID=UPI0030B9BD7C